jgi:Endomembrane protein 70
LFFAFSVELFVNKLTSFDTLVSMDYYRLPFCLPGDTYSSSASLVEQFGDFLAGDHKVTAPYLLKVKEDLYCEQYCISNAGRPEQSGYLSNRFVQAIHNQYRHHWSVDDGLPAGSRIEVEPNYFEKQFN